MKKILFILHLPPPVHGSSMMGKFIKESELLNQSFNTQYIDLGTSKSIDEIGKTGFKKIIHYLSILFSVFKHLLIKKPDVVYLAITAKGLGFYKDFLVVLITKLFSSQLVLHFHNKGVHLNQHKKIDNLLYQITFKNAKVILLSKYLYPDVQKYVNKEDVFYCPNGVPEIKESLTRNNKNKTNQVQLLFLSNLIESKGVYDLLEACKILKNKGLYLFCNFIGGEGDLTAKDFETNVKQLGIADNVIYVGKKYGKEKAEAFLNADIFVFPTYYHNETFGLVNLEAMQYNLPVISTFEGGIPDVVKDGETGFLIKPRDIKMLVNKIEILIKNPELRQQMGAKGKQRYQENFTLKVFENKLLSILTKL